MAEADYQHNKLIILDTANEPVAINPIAPEFGQVSFERFAKPPWIFSPSDP